MTNTISSSTPDEVATDNKDMPFTRRRSKGLRRGVGDMNNLRGSFKACSVASDDSDDSIDDKKDDPNDNDPPPSPLPNRRLRSRARARSDSLLLSRLSRSLEDRCSGGIEGTLGRLTVSFSDQRGLSGATIADILSGVGLDPPDDDEQDNATSFKELMEEQEEAMEGRDNLGALGGACNRPRRRSYTRPQLAPIPSRGRDSSSDEDSS